MIITNNNDINNDNDYNHNNNNDIRVMRVPTYL